MTSENKIVCIGIDLGTTYSSIGFFSFQSNQPELIPDEKGSTHIPSHIHFNEKINDTITVGEIAKTHPEAARTCYDSKRVIGKNYNAIDKTTLNNIYCKTKQNQNGSMVYEMKFKKDGSEIQEEILPEEVSGKILCYLKYQLMKRLSLSDISNAQTVICVPCTFKDEERKATLLAARHAGFENVLLLNEPVASIHEFNRVIKDKRLNKTSRRININDKIVVIDFGGGTLDIACCVCTAENRFTVKSSHGNEHFGGNEFDVVMMNYLLQVLNENNNEVEIDDYIVSSNEMKSDDKRNQTIRKRKNNAARLKILAEKCKRRLSTEKYIQIPMSDLTDNKNDTNEIMITREDFENKCEENKLLKKFEDELSAAMGKCDFSFEEVNHALLVGGSCQIPCIEKIIYNKFRKESIVTEKFFDGMESVCKGCAVVACQRSGTDIQPEINIDVSEVLNDPIGLKVGNTFLKFFNEGDRIPTGPQTKTVRPGRPGNQSAKFEIYKCRNEYVSDSDEFIGELLIENIPPPNYRAGQIVKSSIAKLNVTMEIDEDQILKITVEVDGDPEKTRQLEFGINNIKRDIDFEILHRHFLNFYL